MLATYDVESVPFSFSEAWETVWKTKFQFLNHAEYERLRYQKHLAEPLGKMDLKQITPLTIEQLKSKLLHSGLKAQTITHILGLIRRTFNQLVVWGIYHGVNPASRIKMPREDNRRHRFLTKQEAAELLRSLKMKSETTWQLALLSLSTGLRAGEMLKLKGEHINLESKTIRVLDPKNGRNRTVHLPEVALGMLYELPLKPGCHVFANRHGEPFKTVSDTFARTVEELGLNDGLSDARDRVVFHSLRHTFASWLAENDQPLFVVADLLGHSTLEMTRRYVHLNSNRKQAVTTVLNSYFN